VQQKNNQNQNRIRINLQIRVPQVRVVLEDGSSPGVMSTRDAMKMAQDANLDLVEINPRSVPPVCKILDYGKYKYDEKKKAAAARKTQKQSELKELTFRPNTDEHDLGIKLQMAKEFLKDGNKVKFAIRFRGREITHPQVGKEKLDWLLKELTDLISGTPQVFTEGKIMSMTVNPK
jgi:translation initiation factor IF-3